MFKINPNNIETLKRYGGFMDEVQSDEMGKNFLEKAKSLESNNVNK